MPNKTLKITLDVPHIDGYIPSHYGKVQPNEYYYDSCTDKILHFKMKFESASSQLIYVVNPEFSINYVQHRLPVSMIPLYQFKNYIIILCEIEKQRSQNLNCSVFLPDNHNRLQSMIECLETTHFYVITLEGNTYAD